MFKWNGTAENDVPICSIVQNPVSLNILADALIFFILQIAFLFQKPLLTFDQHPPTPKNPLQKNKSPYPIYQIITA